VENPAASASSAATAPGSPAPPGHDLGATKIRWISWGVHGESMGISGDFHGNLWEIYGINGFNDDLYGIS